jgi:hypothetical protein
MRIETINSKPRSAGWSGFTLIESLPAPLLALGFCALVITGCSKTSAPKVNGEVTVAEMNRAIRMMSLSPLGGPRTVDELTNFPALKGRPFPAPPAGKTFAIDPATRQVVIVKQ